ncbi:hypothetical protein EVAR_72448_1 [Eumeta japonica]|uniref:Helitron helicase-like domain-containing protein n=1 Tax=Eumeta variegata TaxID=151549 RepID=A0A4C2ABR3_EUMVA|nr:hypothetical protein EVAR_72448_1 [Eumeta japonica]
MIFEEITATQRAQLVNSNPVLCCLYFARRFDCIVNAIELRKGPFSEYRMMEYVCLVEFQYRGSFRCHMLLWLEDAQFQEAKFAYGANVHRTLELIDELCTVDSCLVDSKSKFKTR